MSGVLVMLPHVDESTRELNQALVERARCGLPTLFQPERLQHVVGLVVVPPIEMMEIGGVTDIPAAGIHALP